MYQCSPSIEGGASKHTAAQAAPTAAQHDVFKAMMQLEAAKQRDAIANKASLEAELEKDAAEQAVEILKSQLGQKRARQPDAAEEEDDDGEKSSHEWDLADYRRQQMLMTRSLLLQ